MSTPLTGIKISHMKHYEEMREKIGKELMHIPSGVEGSPQNQLRETYWNKRMNLLTGHPKYKTKEDALQAAIQCVKKLYPNFDPQYDEEFFQLEPRESGRKELA